MDDSTSRTLGATAECGAPCFFFGDRGDENGRRPRSHLCLGDSFETDRFVGVDDPNAMLGFAFFAVPGVDAWGNLAVDGGLLLLLMLR